MKIVIMVTTLFLSVFFMSAYAGPTQSQCATAAQKCAGMHGMKCNNARSACPKLFPQIKIPN